MSSLGGWMIRRVGGRGAVGVLALQQEEVRELKACWLRWE